VANQSVFLIQNDLPGPVILNIEPESAFHQLGRGEVATVFDRCKAHPATVKLGRSDKGETVVSV
jgi:hypothetical protein